MSGVEFFGIKLATIVTAFIGAILSIGVDLKSHTKLTAFGSLLAGVFIAAIATEPTIEFFNLSITWGHAVAGIYGISGRNLVVWISRASKNPEGIVSAILKLGKK